MSFEVKVDVAIIFDSLVYNITKAPTQGRPLYIRKNLPKKGFNTYSYYGGRLFIRAKVKEYRPGGGGGNFF